MNSSENFKKLYSIYYSAKSTGFILPILYLYLQEILKLQAYQVLLIAAGYQLLPFILEVPLGYVGDKFGNKKVVLIGLIVQVLSFTSLLVFKNATGYHLYLFFLYFAGAAYSGAETSIIRSHFKANENVQFRTYYTNISTNFYRNTIAFLIIGVIAYQHLYWLPLVLQIVSYLIAFIIMFQIDDHTHDEHAHHSILNLKNENKQVLKYIFKNNRFMGLILIEATFGSSILINHKTIQQTLSNSLNFEPYILLGIIYVAGNIVSYKGSQYFHKRFLVNIDIRKQLILFASIMGSSFVFMAIPNFFMIAIGFLLICLFKAIYRPALASELSNNVLLMKFHSTTLSYVSLISAALSALIHFIISPFFKDYLWGNIAFIFIAIFPFSLGFYLYTRKQLFSFVTEINPLTKMQNIISVSEGITENLQIYPNNFPENHFKNLERNINKSKLSSPSPIRYNNQERSLRYEYQGDKNLSRIDKKKQLTLCHQILNNLFENTNTQNSNNASIPEIIHIFKIGLNEIIQNVIIHFPRMGIIHGDLHPLNIIITNENYIAINWDNSGYGPIWFDALTLVSSPYLSLNYVERIQLLEKHFPELNQKNLHVLLYEFSNFKAIQVRELENGDGFYTSLSKKYLSMIKNFKYG